MVFSEEKQQFLEKCYAYASPEIGVGRIVALKMEPLPMNYSVSNLPSSARTTHQSSGDCGRGFNAWSHYRRRISAVIRLINSLVASSGNGQSRGSAHP